MSRRGPYASAVLYIVVAGPEFKPQRPWSVPESFTEARLYKSHLLLHVARWEARKFNKRQVQLQCRRAWAGEWMIVSACCRRSAWCENSQTAAAKGGAV